MTNSKNPNEETVKNFITFKNINERSLVDLKRSSKINDAIFQDVYGTLNEFYRQMYEDKDRLFGG